MKVSIEEGMSGENLQYQHLVTKSRIREADHNECTPRSFWSVDIQPQFLPHENHNPDNTADLFATALISNRISGGPNHIDIDLTRTIRPKRQKLMTSLRTGQHSQNPPDVLQVQGVPQAPTAQGHPVQGWQG